VGARATRPAHSEEDDPRRRSLFRCDEPDRRQPWSLHLVDGEAIATPSADAQRILER
jgi:hypothetical protein